MTNARTRDKEKKETKKKDLDEQMKGSCVCIDTIDVHITIWHVLVA